MIRTCQTCGQKNRIRGQHLAARVRCAQCKTDIAPIREPIEADEETFDEVLREATVPVLVDFWAAWCGPCRLVAPIVEQLAGEYEGKLKVGKLDVDLNQRTAARFNIRSIPSILFFKDGKLVDTIVGAVPKPALVQKIQQHL